MKVSTLWDNGSTLSFITKRMAKHLNLNGKRIKLTLETVGGSVTSLDTYEYEIIVQDASKELVSMYVIGIDKISSSITPVNIQNIAKLFNISTSEISRPTEGEIDLLLGVRYAGYHPVRCDHRGHLLLLQNRFGKTFQGSHPQIKETTRIESTCLQLRHALVMFTKDSLNESEKFHAIESLGVNCIPKCGSCKCGTCHPGGKNMSLKEEKEYDLIQRNIQFNPDRKRWIASYPWIVDPRKLRENRSIATKILMSTERKLLKNPEHGALYSRQIQDMLDRNAARKITKAELYRYNGPKYYIIHHGVFKPNSTSTPLRIVFNTSATHGDLSMNECLAKGPSLLNNLYGVLLRFRMYKQAFVGDISKMYHSIDIPLKDQMTHLFLWRNLDLDKEPETFAMTVVNMGDRPSATIAQVALRKTAEEIRDEYPDSADIITRNSYMDDILGGGNSEEQHLARRKEIEEALGKHGFVIKEWIYPGSKRQAESDDQRKVQLLMGVINQENESVQGVLGMEWNVDFDCLQVSINREISTNTVITKRFILSVVNGIYDPLGLLTPFTIRAKILLRKIWAHEPRLDWDDDLPASIKSEWMNFISEIDDVRNLQFPRSVNGSDTTGNPILVIFADGSGHAYGTAAYIRWQLANGSFASHLLSAKSRIAPVKLIDTVRLELCGSTISTRLRKSITSESSLIFERTVHLIDSEIVHAMIHRESYGFNTFVGNRLGEIQRESLPTEWGWIRSEDNIADVTTRGCSPNELKRNSDWQCGPAFLSKREEEWPVRWEINQGIHLPEMKRATTQASNHVKENFDSLAQRIDTERFSNWNRLKFVTARVLKLYSRFKSGGDKSADLTPVDLENAEEFWIKDSQRSLNTKDITKLCPMENNGIIYVGGRTERWNACTWNQQEFVVLPKGNRVSYLIALHEHRKGGHLGVDNTISKIRSKYWIIGIRHLVKSIIAHCIHCKIKKKCTVQQVMSPLPIERLKPSPSFENVGVDYFGPFLVKGEVQQRTTGKCYGVLIVCLVSGAVYADLSNDCSTQGFLLVLRRFTSFRGWPKNFFSDKGSNLIGASNILKELVQKFNWDEIKMFGCDKGSNWTFSPADAKWYNGLVESLVKSVKRALTAAIGDSNNHFRMKYGEMLTVMYEAAELVNERPIGRHPSNPDERYLCVNDLLLGRSSSRVPQGPFEAVNVTTRFRYVQAVIDSFWKRWMKEVFPNLVIRKKWHTEVRNLMVGDIVLVQDLNSLRGNWKRAIVSEVLPSKDDKVRRVNVSYITTTGVRSEVERPVQKLILLNPVDEQSS